VTLFVVTSLAFELTPGATIVRATTNVPVQLSAIVQSIRPTTTPRTRLRRGVLETCGFTVNWAPESCAHPAEPQPSLIHTFSIAGTAGAPPQWGALIEGPDCALPAPSTVPFQIPSPEEAVSLPWCQAVLNVNHSLANNSVDLVPVTLILAQGGGGGFTIVGDQLILPIDGVIVARATFFAQGGSPGFLSIYLQPLLAAEGAVSERNPYDGDAGQGPQTTYIGPAQAGDTLQIAGLSSGGALPLGGFQNEYTGTMVAYVGAGL
jgi:hypothetical protein